MRPRWLSCAEATQSRFASFRRFPANAIRLAPKSTRGQSMTSHQMMPKFRRDITDDGLMRLDDETLQWAAELSDEQRAAVVRWQGADRFYEQINAALRGETDDPEALDTADTLLGVVTHPLAGEYTVWRGARSVEAAFDVAADRLEELIGLREPLVRFTSTSLDENVAINEFTKPQLKGGAVLMELALAPGVRAAWIPPIGDQEMAYQQELLLRPGMMQRIVDVVRADFIPIVRMEVTPK